MGIACMYATKSGATRMLVSHFSTGEQRFSSKKNAKYDVAISTACARLDYIVVETASAAQRCVELLRRENLGVATFMILATFNFILYNIQELILSKKLP
ncbi:hypothetical protein FH972_025616 [Carpinus fangiana]|uniref:SMC hinge domain-containing protein n=1 Tax=Carpinus fangiana TaxID=176857 RepID=A0A5N6L445_9ROSI|nr:hypothetical protein FH972_025616 [Carpinus fangiana]